MSIVLNPFTGQFDIVGTSGGGGGVTDINGVSGSVTLVGDGGITITPNSPSPGDITIDGSGVIPSFTAGSVIFSNGTTLAEDNANFFWDDTNNALIIGSNIFDTSLNPAIQVNRDLTDPMNTVGYENKIDTHFTANNSTTVIGMFNIIRPKVDAGFSAHGAFIGDNTLISRVDAADLGTVDLAASYFAQFVQGNGAKTTGQYSSFITGFHSVDASGTIGSLYDFQALPSSIPGGVVTNRYGIFLAADSGYTKNNFLSGNTQVGNSSFVAPVNALEVAGVFGIRDVGTGFQVSFAAPTLASDTPYILPATDGANGDVLTTDGSGNLSFAPSSGANTALSNLTSPTDINQHLLPNTDNSINLGSDTEEFKDLWVYTINHNSVGTPNLLIQTTGNNGNVQLKANGTGSVSSFNDFIPESPALDIGGLGSVWANVFTGTVSGDDTGNLNIISGAGSAGNIIVTPDPTGKIQLVDGTEGTAGYVWTSIDTNGTGSWLASAANNKEIFVLSGTDITNQYIDLSEVARTNSINFVVQGAGSQIEGGAYDYSVNYTGGAGGNTRITFLNGLATGGDSELLAGDVVAVQYEF